jgi:hypothetical protein
MKETLDDVRSFPLDNHWLFIIAKNISNKIACSACLLFVFTGFFLISFANLYVIKQ